MVYCAAFWTSRTGTLVTACFTTVESVLRFATQTAILHLIDKNEPNAYELMVTSRLIIFFCVVFHLASILLLIGTHKGCPRFLLPWIILLPLVTLFGIFTRILSIYVEMSENGFQFVMFFHSVIGASVFVAFTYILELVVVGHYQVIKTPVV